jgi:DNA adenine methylase
VKHTNFINQKIAPAFVYFGGKSLLSRRVLSFIGDHHTYVEPFAGGLNVLINKYRSSREVASDLSQEIIELYQVLVSFPRELSDRIRGIPYTKEIFATALRSPRASDPLDRAVNTFIKYQMSRNGRGQDFFHSDHFPDDSRRWTFRADSLVRTAERLQGVEFRCQDAFQVIKELDSLDTCFYIDPPYYPATRLMGHKYNHELSSFDHFRLLRLLKSCRGQVILSGYPSEIYDRELAGWVRVEFDLVSNSSQASGRRIGTRVREVLWVKQNWLF